MSAGDCRNDAERFGKPKKRWELPVVPTVRVTRTVTEGLLAFDIRFEFKVSEGHETE